MPTQKYASGDEIREYARAFGTKFDLYRDACFQTHVKEMCWDDDVARWIVWGMHIIAIGIAIVAFTREPGWIGGALAILLGAFQLTLGDLCGQSDLEVVLAFVLDELGEVRLQKVCGRAVTPYVQCCLTVHAVVGFA